MLRALLVNQGPAPGQRPPGFARRAEAAVQDTSLSLGDSVRVQEHAEIPEPAGTASTMDDAGPQQERRAALRPSELVGEPAGAPTVIAPGSVAGPQERNSSLQTAAYWLTRALLLRHLLAEGVNQSARVPEPQVLRSLPRADAHSWDATERRSRAAVASWRIPSVLYGRALGATRRAGAVADRARDALAPAKGLAVPRYMLYVEVAAVALLTLLALFLRAWDLLPGSLSGIHGDETEMALEALRSMESGGLGIWSGVTLGHPAGYAHWMALIFRLGGADVTTMRLASAIPGVAIIPVGYLLVRSLFPFRVAILTAAMLTFSLWFVIQSRIAFGGITAVFMAMLAMWLLIEAAQRRNWWIAVAAGVALGLGLYTFKTFLLYYTGIFGAAILCMAVSREMRNNQQLWLSLDISVVAGGPMLLFYATSGFIGPNLNELYHVSLSSPSTWVGIPRMALDAVLLVHLPVEGNTTDGAPPIPILPMVSALLFWVGLAAALLFVRQRRCQLLLTGWLIGMLPILFVPGVESRRYLLGVFFVLVIVAIGIDALTNFLASRIRWHLTVRDLSLAGTARIVAASGLALAIASVALFSAQNLREVERWSDGGSVRWFFNHEYYESLLFLKDLDADLPVRYYTGRQPFDSSLRRFVLPDAVGTDGGREFGANGELPSRDEIAADTIFVLLDQYLPLAEALDTEFPGSVRLGHKVENGTTLFTVYLVSNR